MNSNGQHNNGLLPPSIMRKRQKVTDDRSQLKVISAITEEAQGTMGTYRYLEGYWKM